MTEDQLLRFLTLRHQMRTNIRSLAYILGYYILVKYWKFFHEAALNVIHNERFSLILIPRGFFKTTLFTILDTIQDILNDPNTTQAIISYTGKNARDMLVELSNHFLVNDDLRFLFAEIVPVNVKRPETGDWTSEGFTVIRKDSVDWKESTVEAYGSDMAITSRHFDKLRFDDLVVEQNTTTADQIRKTDTYLQRCYSLLKLHDTKSKAQLVGTRWVPDDTYGKIEGASLNDNSIQEKIYAPDGSSYKVYKIDAEVSEGVSVYPELFPWQTLKGIEKGQEGSNYSALYRNDPDDIKNAFWSKDLIKWYTELPADINLQIYGALDPAISTRDVKDRSDTANVIIGIDQKNELWILETAIHKGIDDALYDEMFEFYLHYSIMTVPSTSSKRRLVGRFIAYSLETVTFQKLIQRELVRRMQLKNIWLPIVQDNPHTDKTKRIMILNGIAKSGGIHAKVGMSAFQSQFIRFGRPNTKVDILDAIAQAYKKSMIVSMIPSSTSLPKEDDIDDFEEMFKEGEYLGAIH